MSKLILVSSVLVFLFSPFAVHAEDDIVVSGDTSVRVRIEQKINTVKNNIIERKEVRIENRNENREERRAEFAKKHSERIAKRFAEYYSRLTKIISKVELKVVGNSEAKAKLDEAKAKLEDAKKLGDEAIVLFNLLTTGNLGESDDKVSEAKNKVELARKAFVETMKLTRDALKIAKSNEE